MHRALPQGDRHGQSALHEFRTGSGHGDHNGTAVVGARCALHQPGVHESVDLSAERCGVATEHLGQRLHALRSIQVGQHRQDADLFGGHRDASLVEEVLYPELEVVSHTAHQPNEFSLLSNMLGDARVMAHVFLGEE